MSGVSVCTMESEKATCDTGRISLSKLPNGPLVWYVRGPPTNLPPISSLSFRAFRDNIPLGHIDLVPIYWVRTNGGGWASYSFPSGTPIRSPEDLVLRPR